MDNDIREFRGDYFFMSNFYPATLEYEGLTYATSEHAYQAAKATTDLDREYVRSAHTAGLAKRRGREIECRPGWDDMKVMVMRKILRAKFEANHDLVERLVSTGEALLVESNEWNDRFWGVCRGKGQNWLGRLLMKEREHWLRLKLLAEAKSMLAEGAPAQSPYSSSS